jgi:protein TonB
MPHDLFGDVLVRPRAVRARRSSVAIVSVVAHGATIVAFLITPLIATDPSILPAPQRAVAFLADRIVPVVPAPSLGPSARSRSSAPNATDNRAAAAPLEAPSEIKPESGLEASASRVGPGGPPIVGLMEGLGPVSAPVGPPPAPPPPTAPVRLHMGIHGPQKLVDVPPPYPPAARTARIEGVVIIEATIDTSGNVVAARALKSAPFLEQAALEAVRQWKFTPTLLNGVPVPVIMTVTVNFTLK